MNILINGFTGGTVPPQEYGGIERVNAFLVKGLQELGYDPVLLCREGSTINCRKLMFSTPLPGDGHKMLTAAETHYGHFDILHDSSCNGLLLNTFRQSHPVFWTVHGPGLNDGLTAYLSKGSTYKHDRERSDNLPHTYLGLDLSLYNPCYDKDNYILFIGQAKRHKYLHYFTAVAKAHGLCAIVIAPKDGMDADYLWENFKEYPFAWIPGADDATKCRYIRKAKCIVHCSEDKTWADASPVAILESLALGTPVIGNYSGGIPEMIQHGITGFLVNNEAEAIQAYSNINQIKPPACRQYMEEQRNHLIFAKRMLVIYKALANLPYAERCVKIRTLQLMIDEVTNV